MVVWNAATGEIYYRFEEHDARIAALCFSDDEVRCPPSLLPSPFPLVLQLRLTLLPVRFLHSPDALQRVLMSSGNGSDGKIFFWDMATGHIIARSACAPDIVACVVAGGMVRGTNSRGTTRHSARRIVESRVRGERGGGLGRPPSLARHR